MGHRDQEQREVLSLAQQLSMGGFSEKKAERFKELTGLSIGDVRYRSQFEYAFLVEFDSELAIQKFNSVDPMVGAELLEKAAERDPSSHIELWGAPWSWSDPIAPILCVSVKNRPNGADLKEVVTGAHERWLNEEASFEPNAFQKIAAEHYGEGDFSYLNEIRGRDSYEAHLDDVGDTLFRFIIIELGNQEGCDNAEEATSRMMAAAEDVKTVMDELFELEQGAPQP